MPGPRDYKRSTIFALAALGQGTCYWPSPPCTMPLLVHVEGQPITNLEIAHIRAADPNGPRAVKGMPDDVLRSWSNLILLCKPHHVYVDKIRPDDFSIETLQTWKAKREQGGLAKLNELSNAITEDRLQEMLADSAREAYQEIRRLLAEHKPIDPDAAMLLNEVATRLSPTLSEYGPALERASTVLSEYGPMLNTAAATLSGSLESLHHSIQMLRNIQGSM
jgi:hypothetical protein